MIAQITGSATEAVQTAHEQLSLAKKDPRHLFLCGPTALRMLLLAITASSENLEFLRWYRASPKGTNLSEVAGLATKAKFDHRVIFRQAGQSVPVPSVIHWKVGHFAAIVGKSNGRFHVQDPVFPGRQIWATQAALDSEASGYFLVSRELASGGGWRTVEGDEAATVWGKGPTNGTPPGIAGPQDPSAHSPGSNGFPGGGGSPLVGSPGGGNSPFEPNPPDCGMCTYDIGESTVSLSLSDTPVGYTPSIGPSPWMRIAYNQREDSQPANATFFNVGPKWTLNWLTYITDDPTNLGANVSRYIAGGGAYFYAGYQSASGEFTAQNYDGSILVLASQSPVTYRRQLGDGSAEIYAQSDGSATYPRRIFLSQVIDPQGNALMLNYDSQMRLVSLVDATGRQTTLHYEFGARPFLITKVADPFGRAATLTYDSTGRLTSITDVIGLKSSVTYDANSLVNSLATPYGTTTFAYTAPGTNAPPRYVQVTDPLGYNERVEWIEPAPIPDSDPPNTVPSSMPLVPKNQYLTYRNSFYWDKNAYALAGCTQSGGCDYTKARNRHFAHDAINTNQKSTTIESVKYPLENRIWLNYPGQTASNYSGSYTQPIATGRVLDDGTTQISRASYDTAGFYKLTQLIDPLGRTTSFSYGNGIDLSAVSQRTAYGVWQLAAQFAYNTQHRPILYTDAAGQTTSYTYNPAGQLTSATNPLGQKTSYQYNTAGDLIAITNANNQTAASFTYDSFDRVRTFTDSEGRIVTYDYDAADRVTKITYPDGTNDLYTYDKLDLASYHDRQSRLWAYTHDANRRLTAITNPLDQQTLFGHDNNGNLTSLTDPGGKTTTWSYDVQNRLTQKKYADNSTVTYGYENTTSRLKSVLDALGQTRQFSYAIDDQLTGISYLSAVNPTPNVSFSYDPHFPRMVSMSDGIGTTLYSYFPVGSLGALQRQQETGPLPSSTMAYAYDALGRLTSRNVSGAGTETFGYDMIGRTTSHGSDLGQFTLSYLGQTGQIAARELASSTVKTTWGYLPNSGDRRLASIGNIGFSASQFSNYQFTTTPENFISAIVESSDSTTVYPGTAAQTASYNNLNQLTNLSGQTLTYDANGNLTADGQRTFSWDAENRLVGVTYPGQPGKQTTFAYDGLSRRVAISSTPAGGGSAATKSYIWCGARICQARDATNAPTREYFAEGEFVPGSPGQPYNYAIDQIGSVRRAFADAANAPAYSYDPYGNTLQAPAPDTDFGYAGMFYNADSGLYLTLFRAYDPVAGRWLSRDPIDNISGDRRREEGNLYQYVRGNPISLYDPLGLQDNHNVPTPRNWSCTAGGYDCLSNLPSTSRGACMAAEAACNLQVALCRHLAPNIVTLYHFPHGGRVIIHGGTGYSQYVPSGYPRTAQ